MIDHTSGISLTFIASFHFIAGGKSTLKCNETKPGQGPQYRAGGVGGRRKS
jgi:hypothetical protein